MSAIKEALAKHKQYLLTGVSYVVPLIACGGILLAIGFAIEPPGQKAGDGFGHQVAALCLDLGGKAFSLMGAVLAAFIAYAMVNKPGLVPGLVGGLVATTAVTLEGGKSVSAGFLGAIIAGLLAGHGVKAVVKLPVPKFVKPIMPILVIPIVSTLVVGGLMTLLNIPLAHAMNTLTSQLEAMQAGSAVVLALVLGAMIAFDMGGPVNKAAFFFASGMIAQGNIYLMGPVAVAICVPPIGLGLATLLGRKLWSEQERESGVAALGMGLCGITEGAIPFAAASPLRVIPAIMAGSMTGAAVAMLGHAGDHAPHGGLIVLPVVEGRVQYVVAVLAGSAVTAGIMTAFKWRDAKKSSV